MSCLAAVGFDPAVCKVPAPDNIITGVERKTDLHSIAFGCNADKGRTFPLRSGSSVIFRNHKGAMGHLRVPVRYKDGIERLWLAYLRTFDYNHEIRNERIEQLEFCFGGGGKVI